MIPGMLFIVWCLATIFAGLLFTATVLGERRLHILVPAGILIGTNGYLIIVNCLSFFFKIQTVSKSVFLVFVLIDILTIIKLRGKLSGFIEKTFDRKQYRALFITAVVISVLMGIVALRALALDDLSLGHLPLAATIAEGNFPIMDPASPDHVLSYHYGPDLLASVLNIATGIPLWLGYDVQMFLFVGPGFLLAFALLFELLGSYRAAFAGALASIYAVGWQWFAFFSGAATLWKKYVLHVAMDNPWTFIAHTVFTRLNTSFVVTVNNHSIGMGMPVIFLVLLLVIQSLSIQHAKKYWAYLITASVFFAYLALSLETYAAVILIALFLLGCAVVWQKFTKKEFVRTNNYSVTGIWVLLIISIIIIAYQGGIFTGMRYDTSHDSFELVKNVHDFVFLDLFVNPGHALPVVYMKLFSFDFLSEFGSPLLLLPFVLWWFRKKPLVLWVFIIGLGSFMVPLLIHYPERPWEMTRFFTFAMILFSLLLGAALAEWYDRFRNTGNKVAKTATILVFLSLVFFGLTSQLAIAITPMDKFGQIHAPFLAIPQPPTQADAAAYSWAKANTTLFDRFFPYNLDFMMNTGRYTPGSPMYTGFSKRPEDKILYEDLSMNCSPEAAKALKISYLYAGGDFIPSKQCLKKLNASLVHEVKLGTDKRSIYKVSI